MRKHTKEPNEWTRQQEWLRAHPLYRWIKHKDLCRSNDWPKPGQAFAACNCGLDDAIEKLSVMREAQRAPWRVHLDGKHLDDWPLADFGACGHHNKESVWVTTDRMAASMTNGACPCEDAAYVVALRNLFSGVENPEQAVRQLVAAARNVMGPQEPEDRINGLRDLAARLLPFKDIA